MNRKVYFIILVALSALYGCSRVGIISPQESKEIEITISLGIDDHGLIVTKGSGTEDDKYNESSDKSGPSNVGKDGLKWYVTLLPSNANFDGDGPQEILEQATYIKLGVEGSNSGTFTDRTYLDAGDYIFIACACYDDQNMSRFFRLASGMTYLQNINDEMEDIYVALSPISVSEGNSDISVELKSIFGKLRIVAEDYSSRPADIAKISIMHPSRYQEFFFLTELWDEPNKVYMESTALPHYTNEDGDSKTILIDYIPLNYDEIVNQTLELKIEYTNPNTPTDVFITNVPINLKRGELVTLKGNIFSGENSVLKRITDTDQKEFAQLPSGTEFNSILKLHQNYTYEDIKVVTSSSLITDARVAPDIYLYRYTTENADGYNDYHLEIHTSAKKLKFPEDCSQMFSQLWIKKCDINWESCITDGVKDMSGMFFNNSNIISVDFTNFNASSVESMAWMFRDCDNLTSITGGLSTQNVTSMERMFEGCSSLTSLDLRSFNTAKVTDMSFMFARCNNLTSIDLSSFNTQEVTNMANMFYNCGNISSLDLSNFITNKVRYMAYMFYNCNNLSSLNIRNFTFYLNPDNLQSIFSMVGSSATNKPIPIYVYPSSKTFLEGYSVFTGINPLYAYYSL